MMAPVIMPPLAAVESPAGGEALALLFLVVLAEAVGIVDPWYEVPLKLVVGYPMSISAFASAVALEPAAIFAQ
jgi:hypothetical protein